LSREPRHGFAALRCQRTTVRSIVATCAILLLAAALSSPVAAAPDSPRATVSHTDFQFGRVLSGPALVHEFVLRNNGVTPLRVLRIQLTTPLVVTKMPAVVAPGTEAPIDVKLETSGLRGLFTGTIQILLEGSELPEITLTIAGEIVPLVEISPAPAFFLGARRGENRHASVDIINHAAEPLRIVEVSHSQDKFTTTLETLEEGQRYRLTMFLKPDGPGGKQSESIVLRTSSQSAPTVTIAANTYLRERVYTFPDAVDFGVLSLGSIQRDPGLLDAFTQRLMVYQFGGTDFVIRLRDGLPQLRVTPERGPQGDRYQNTVALVREQLRVGTIRGSIVFATNDSQFREVVVPVVGTIIP
jgi:Protein of unknown function (DUF1573)